MMKPNALRWLPAMLLVLILYPAFERQGHAQAPATYKVGDRVDLLVGSANIGGKYVGGKWQPGTIVQVTQAAYELMYLVHHDDDSSNHDNWASSLQLRAPTGLISETAKVRNELAALGALKAPKAGSLDETFQNLIRERSELQGSKELPVTVTFQGFLVGETHRYARPDVDGESADGPGGTANTIVYPVSAQSTVRTAYRDAFLTYQWDERYSCFKNAFGKWDCNLTGGRGMIKQFREERADYH
jgi:hypothetical protein